MQSGGFQAFICVCLRFRLCVCLRLLALACAALCRAPLCVPLIVRKREIAKTRGSEDVTTAVSQLPPLPLRHSLLSQTQLASVRTVATEEPCMVWGSLGTQTPHKRDPKFSPRSSQRPRSHLFPLFEAHNLRTTPRKTLLNIAIAILRVVYIFAVLLGAENSWNRQ